MHTCQQELTALFQPFSVCEDYINPAYLKAELSKCILQAMRYIHDLTEEELKEKEVLAFGHPIRTCLTSTNVSLQVGCVSDLLKSLKSVLSRCSLWDMVATVDNLRLDTTIRMLNIPHFNAKMNALKEVRQDSSLPPSLCSLHSFIILLFLIGCSTNRRAIPSGYQGSEKSHSWTKDYRMACE